MDATLKALAGRIERAGMVVAPFGDHLSVRLPLFCQVRVRLAGGRLRCEPFTGALPRTTGTWLIFLAFGAMLVTMLQAGITASALSIGFIAALGGAYEAIRYVLTESCVTRVQALVLAEPSLLGALDAAPDAAPGGAPEGVLPRAADAGRLGEGRADQARTVPVAAAVGQRTPR